MKRFSLPTWQGAVVMACLLLMGASLVFVFLVSTGAFAR